MFPLQFYLQMPLKKSASVSREFQEFSYANRFLFKQWQHSIASGVSMGYQINFMQFVLRPLSQ